MAKIVHPILGAIDLSAAGFWDATFGFARRSVAFDLTIDGGDTTAADVEGLPCNAADVEELDRAARLAILHDAQFGDDDSAAKLYITHHQSELPAADFKRLFGTDSPDLADSEALLSRLVLVRVGLYPESEDGQVLLDYSIDPDVTNYLLCVSFDSSRQAVAVDLES